MNSQKNNVSLCEMNFSMNDSEFFWDAAKVFSGNNLRNALFEGLDETLSKIYFKNYNKFNLGVEPTYQEIVERSYLLMTKYYRNEYYFKNLIANKLFLKQENPKKSVYLSEFRIGDTIADVVIINGRSKVFEIKTELDSPDRLLKQINSYRKVFEEVYVVTFYNLEEKYLKIIPSDVGLYVVTKRGAIKKVKEATIQEDHEFENLFYCLRKTEYSNIVKKVFGRIPKVSSVRFFKACKILLKAIPADYFYEEWKVQIKNRQKLIPLSPLENEEVPRQLVHWYLSGKVKKSEIAQMSEAINNKLNKYQELCTYLI